MAHAVRCMHHPSTHLGGCRAGWALAVLLVFNVLSLSLIAVPMCLLVLQFVWCIWSGMSFECMSVLLQAVKGVYEHLAFLLLLSCIFRPEHNHTTEHVLGQLGTRAAHMFCLVVAQMYDPKMTYGLKLVPRTQTLLE